MCFMISTWRVLFLLWTLRMFGLRLTRLGLFVAMTRLRLTLVKKMSNVKIL